MKNLFHIDSIYHTAAKKGKAGGSPEELAHIEALKKEGLAIIEKLRDKVQFDSRYMEIRKELESLAMVKQKIAYDALIVLVEAEEKYRTDLVSEAEEDWYTASQLNINTNSDAYNLLKRLNHIASQKLLIVVNDFQNFNTAPYRNCIDSGAREWASRYANKKEGHSKIYIEALNELKNSNIWFMPEDFFSANAPVVYEYYAHDPSKLSAINNFLLQRFNLYANRSKSSGGYDPSMLRRDLQDQKTGPLSGVPWHLTVYSENGTNHLFAEKLLIDFTERLAQEDPQAMCLLMGRMRKKLNYNLKRGGYFEGKYRSGDQESDVVEQAAAGASAPVRDYLQQREYSHSKAAQQPLLKGVVVDGNLFSDGPDSISYKFNDVFTKYSNGLQAMVELTNQNTHGFRYAQLIGQNLDFQDAAAQLQEKINNWKYIYEHEKKLRTQDGKFINKWGSSNLDIIFSRVAFEYGDRAPFVFRGKKGIVSIKLVMKPGNKTVDVSKHDSNGEVIGVYKNIKTWSVDSIDVELSWSGLAKNGLTGNTATGFLIRDASKGDSQISVNNASIFKPGQKVFITSSQSVESGSANETNYETDLYVEKTIDNQTILLKSPLRFDWDIVRSPFVRVKSDDKSDNMPEHISEIGDVCLQQEISIDANRKSTENFPSGPFSTLSVSYLEGKDREDIALDASIVREELAANFHLLQKLSSGFKGKKSADQATRSLQSSNPAEYESYTSLKESIVDYLKRKLVYFKNKSGLTDEAIECYASIGYPSLVESIKKIENAIVSASNADENNRLQIYLKELTMARDLFKVILLGGTESSYKGQRGSMDTVKWFEESARVLVESDRLGEILADTQNKQLYAMIQNQSSMIMKNKLDNMDDFHVLDFAATIMRGAKTSADISACGVERQRLMEDMHKYVASNPDIAFVQSQMFRVCAANVSQNKKADCNNCYAKTSSSSAGIYEDIDQWLRHIARKTYLD